MSANSLQGSFLCIRDRHTPPLVAEAKFERRTSWFAASSVSPLLWSISSAEPFSIWGEQFGEFTLGQEKVLTKAREWEAGKRMQCVFLSLAKGTWRTNRDCATHACFHRPPFPHLLCWNLLCPPNSQSLDWHCQFGNCMPGLICAIQGGSSLAIHRLLVSATQRSRVCSAEFSGSMRVGNDSKHASENLRIHCNQGMLPKCYEPALWCCVYCDPMKCVSCAKGRGGALCGLGCSFFLPFKFTLCFKIA